MDLISTSLLLLALLGCCAGQILPTGPVDALLGKNVTLTTLLEKPEYTLILWNLNRGSQSHNVATLRPGGALTVGDQYEDRASVDVLTGGLTLQALTADDTGDYGITVVLPVETLTGEIKLRVLEPVSDVVIKSNMADAVEDNSTVVLTCTAKGSFLSFTWLTGTTPIVADGKRITLSQEESSSSLTIRPVLRADQGLIYCSAFHTLQTEKSAPFNLTVYYGPDQVTISPPQTPEFISSASDFKLVCSAPSSSPQAVLYWYHNSMMMENSGSLLTLETIKQHSFGEGVGNFTCVAENPKSKHRISSSMVRFGVMDPVSGLQISGPTETLIAGNSTANISCRAAGPVTTRTWMKDGKPLPANSRLVVAADKTSLRINVLQKEDNGEYTCQLGNPVGSKKISYKMVVNYGPEAATVAGDGAVEVNDKVTLACGAPSVPTANFTWKFNGTLTDVKTAMFTIDKAAYRNTGTYTCEASNTVTGKTSMSSHFLSVKEEGALDEGLSDGAIAGIVIAVLVALGAAIGLIMYCRQKVPVESPY